MSQSPDRLLLIDRAGRDLRSGAQPGEVVESLTETGMPRRDAEHLVQRLRADHGQGAVQRQRGASPGWKTLALGWLTLVGGIALLAFAAWLLTLDGSLGSGRGVGQIVGIGVAMTVIGGGMVVSRIRG